MMKASILFLLIIAAGIAALFFGIKAYDAALERERQRQRDQRSKRRRAERLTTRPTLKRWDRTWHTHRHSPTAFDRDRKSEAEPRAVPETTAMKSAKSEEAEESDYVVIRAVEAESESEEHGEAAHGGR